MGVRIALTLCIAAFCGFSATEPFQPADLAGWNTVTDARISPDGGWLAYSRQSGGKGNLLVISLDNKPPIPIAADPWVNRSPRFSYDSQRLAWLSEKSGPGDRQVRILVRRMDTGAVSVIANLQVDPLTIAPAPEGDAVAFTARVPTESAPPVWAPRELLPRLAPPPSHIQVFVLETPSSAPRRLSAGDFDYPGEPAWMPDGQTVVAARAGGEIYAFRLSGGEKALSHHAGRNECPAPSPDGGKIAWLASDPQPTGYAIRKLWVMNADGSRVKILSGSLDRDAADPQWSSDSRTVYFLADDRGATHAYAARNDGAVHPLPGETQRMTGLSLADNGTAVTVRSTAMAAGEVIAFPTDRAAEIRVLAAPNRELLAGRVAGPVEELSYTSDGQTIQAWLTKPPGFNAARKYPLLVDLRDNPHAMCGFEFNLRAQIFAARGFVVLCANPRGTAGFGEEFGNLLPTRFPDGAADDVLRGVDAVLGKGYIDPQRLYVSGGMLAAWIIGHTPRFAAAVTRRPVVDWTMDALLSPKSRAAAWLGALPWSDPEQYARRSPISYAGAIRTPTLVIAPGDDPQAAALYFALQSRQVESALLRIPTGPDAAARRAELEAELAWIGRPQSSSVR